jgi:zinc/manganese transport system substrate-binding protein/zinc transport system substrate-binding protein/manganese/iron transport system substrate-binding protein
MVRQITDVLSQVAPSHAMDFQRNQASYLLELQRVTAELVDRLRPVSDRRMIVHHPAWPYFARRFGLQIVGEIQLQSGAEPSPRHLQALIAQIRRDHIKVIVSEPQLNQKLPRILARESGARLVMLTPLPGGVPGTDTYLDMLRYNVLQLVNAFDGA